MGSVYSCMIIYDMVRMSDLSKAHVFFVQPLSNPQRGVLFLIQGEEFFLHLLAQLFPQPCLYYLSWFVFLFGFVGEHDLVYSAFEDELCLLLASGGGHSRELC